MLHSKMKKMRLPDGPIRQKMLTDGLKEKEISLFFDAVNSGKNIIQFPYTTNTTALPSKRSSLLVAAAVADLNKKGGSAGGGVSGAGLGTITGASSLTDLVNKLANVQDKIADVTFATLTGGISKSAAQKQLDTLQAEFRVLEKQANTLAANPQILINVSAIDTEGAARAVAKALNDSAARSTPSLVGTTVGR